MTTGSSSSIIKQDWESVWHLMCFRILRVNCRLIMQVMAHREASQGRLLKDLGIHLPICAGFFQDRHASDFRELGLPFHPPPSNSLALNPETPSSFWQQELNSCPSKAWTLNTHMCTGWPSFYPCMYWVVPFLLFSGTLLLNLLLWELT